MKELDDEEASYATLGEPLYRVETGNYEYRQVLDLTIRLALLFTKCKDFRKSISLHKCKSRIPETNS